MEEQQGISKSHENVDRIGAVASTACAIHCALCALIPASFAALGLDFLLSHEVEWGLTLVAVGFGLVALYFAWTRHRSASVLALLVVGIVGLLAARGIEGGEHHDSHGDSDEHAEVDDHKKDGDKKGGDEKKEHKKEEKHADADHAVEEEHHDDHGPGEAIGIFAGLLLMAGHVTNFRAIRRRKECSDASAEA